MMRNNLSDEDFVRSVFCPNIAILISDGAEKFAASNNLTFSQLLLPSSSKIKEVFLKDGNNILHTVKGLKLRFREAFMPCSSDVNLVSKIETLDYADGVETQTIIDLNGTAHKIQRDTPWYDSWKHNFLLGLNSYEHDFLNRFLGCLYVVTTRDPDPLGAFSTLVCQQAQLAKTNPHQWFSSELANFFVLITEPEMVSAPEANKIFQAVSATYGNKNCYLLNLSSLELLLTVPQDNKKDVNFPTTQHQDKLTAFVEDFVERILIPWAESVIKNLNDQIAHRLRRSRGFFSVTRKIFGGFSSAGSSSNPGIQSQQASLTLLDGLPQANSDGSLPVSQSDSQIDTSSQPVYADNAPELQMRRLADLSYLFQQFESAHQIYDLLKRDFKDKCAWLHYAGVQEMSAISTFLQGALSQRQYPQHQMDDAIVTYISKCKNSELALRAALLHTEALKSRDLFAEAAACFLRVADVHDYLAGGLLLEQAAHCSLRSKRPHLRHFAMRMALAGVRFARAKQFELSARSFTASIDVLRNRGWSLTEDHLNENLASQYMATGRPEESLQFIRQLISPLSLQLEPKQRRYLRDFLTTTSSMQQKTSIGAGELPELALPVVEKSRIKVLLGSSTGSKKDICSDSDTAAVEARGVAFSDDEYEDTPDSRVFASHMRCLPPNFQSVFLNTVGSSIPAWMLSSNAPQRVDTLKGPADEDDGERSLRKKPGDEFIHLLYGRPLYPLLRGAVFRRLETLMSLHGGQDVGQKNSTTANPCLLVARPRNRTTEAFKKRLHRLPVGEKLTVEIPLHNPWHIPLVLTDIHLVWQASFLPTDSTSSDVDEPTATPRSVISNEEINPELLRAANKYVVTERVNEFYMLPADRKQIHLSIQMRQHASELTILGLAFTLNATSPHQEERLEGATASTGTPAPSSSSSSWNLGLSPSASSSTLSTGTGLHGVAALDCLPFLSANTPHVAALSETDLSDTAHSTSPSTLPLVDPLRGSDTTGFRGGVRGKVLFATAAGEEDPRFQWTVTSPMALLKAVYEGFPEQLFEGEVYSNSLTLTNVGLCPLTSLHVASSWPAFFYLSPGRTVAPTLPHFLTPIHGNLGPTESRSETFWLRAPGLSRKAALAAVAASTATVHFVFGYSSGSSKE